jgi:hypothetical protein
MLCLFATVISSVTYAEALLNDPSDKNYTTQKKQPKPLGTAVSGAGNVTPIVNSANVPQIMTCWQYGKLILEQPVIPPKDKATDILMLHNPQSGKEILAIDFKSAFCLIK